MTATIDFYSQEARKPMLSDPEDTDLVVGKDFLGYTPLNHPRGECVADVIAVTGLAGHAFGSWRHEDGKMWLRDLLPQDLPAVRVMIYGYSAQVQGATQATSILEDHAETFRQRLLSFRRFEPKRPLILIVSPFDPRVGEI
ncbi:uncharacterized protein BO66DRAFT_435905 [Aspergillus aculeatinus CBS 121060]|uniref:Uncharacterized protein n=1 Tax=Aspergillus aculeatinus CBS 121060 TaxID=1448322 RepID=A0ACD1HHL9_9EURO|nr:hypothetical protein BO66DRAFT_435905 [Aspergillus aculeatinus CBS 121060]RAH73011.1 hypothetical protein BO66DRAFT_435905 [Aspergillus aculeatinus CBS 121060]